MAGCCLYMRLEYALRSRSTHTMDKTGRGFTRFTLELITWYGYHLVDCWDFFSYGFPLWKRDSEILFNLIDYFLISHLSNEQIHWLIIRRLGDSLSYIYYNFRFQNYIWLSVFSVSVNTLITIIITITITRHMQDVLPGMWTFSKQWIFFINLIQVLVLNTGISQLCKNLQFHKLILFLIVFIWWSHMYGVNKQAYSAILATHFDRSVKGFLTIS